MSGDEHVGEVNRMVPPLLTICLIAVALPVVGLALTQILPYPASGVAWIGSGFLIISAVLTLILASMVVLSRD